VSSNAKQRPIADGLFTWPAEDPQLNGSGCRDCGAIVFPAQTSCPRCTGTNTEPRLLGRRGTLWSFTVQGFMPKAPYASDETPENFTPYGVGYIELPGEVRVEARLRENDPNRLRIGMPMELVIVPYRSDEHGVQLLTYEFAPMGSARH
jgi:uncharacterized protein